MRYASTHVKNPRQEAEGKPTGPFVTSADARLRVSAAWRGNALRISYQLEQFELLLLLL
jgi:hypothetical protein